MCLFILPASLGLQEEQLEFQKVALAFANNEMAPYMKEWDLQVFFVNDFNKSYLYRFHDL